MTTEGIKVYDFGGYAYISAELKFVLSKIAAEFVGFEEIRA
jgi:hypothetical protein